MRESEPKMDPISPRYSVEYSYKHQVGLYIAVITIYLPCENEDTGYAISDDYDFNLELLGEQLFPKWGYVSDSEVYRCNTLEIRGKNWSAVEDSVQKTLKIARLTLEPRVKPQHEISKPEDVSYLPL